jgi:hypothetical protein
MQVRCPNCLVATQVQSILRAYGVTVIQFIGPLRDDPSITVMVQQQLSVAKEPAIRREIQCIIGTAIVG